MEHYTRSSLNYFTLRALDRAADKRADDAWFAAHLQDANARFVPVWREENLFTMDDTPKPIFLSSADAGEFIAAAESIVLLGKDEERATFALGLPDGEEKPPRLAELGKFRNLRWVAALLAERDCALLTYAKLMTDWHHHHRFCGACGSPTKSISGGHARICTDAGCGQTNFPQMSPAIIVLVTSGDRCLLGRKPEWPQGVYSTLAGFVEPAESLEAALIREVREEAGVEIASMRYFASQPWPFPNSLMLSFTAQAASEEIRIDQDEAQRELEDARWFTRQEIWDGLQQGTLRLPLKLAISFHLIESWFDAGSLGSLREIGD
ncbi:MAG: NAD(+) diphosphatase [Anaerolineae bacterium]|nr:NAD(+) diphosphatase [Anaerolineae bacterium]